MEFSRKIRNISIFSFFSGSGFLDLGFEYSGFNIVFVNEINPSFLNAYKHAHLNLGMSVPKYGYCNESIETLLSEKKAEFQTFLDQERQSGKIVGFIGGPPCPDFSVAGKNRGRNGNNGKLTSVYFDLIQEMKPSFFVFENVKGLWKTEKHRRFYDEQKERIIESGYQVTDKLLNALEFGVPQDRERIIMFGIQNEMLSEKHIASFDWLKGSKYKIETVMGKKWPQTDEFIENSIRACPKNVIKKLTVEYWFEKNKVLDHPNANDFFAPKVGKKRMNTILEGDVSRKSYKRLHRWRFSPTVAYGNNEVHLHPYKVRRISVAEALALQGLPRNFSLPKDMTLTEKFKTICNGVPFGLSLGIAASVRDFLS